MRSKHTKSLRAKYWAIKVLDLLVLCVPLAVYVGFTLFSGGEVVTATSKICVTGASVVALAITAWNFLCQKHLRAPIWIVLLALYFAVGEYLLPLIICLAIGTILDEMAFRPLLSNMREKLNASKVIDKRLGDDLH